MLEAYSNHSETSSEYKLPASRRLKLQLRFEVTKESGP